MKRGGRSVIVDAALASVEERGWEATSMQAVRERAGVSNGSLFHHFPTRADLAAAVVAAGLADHRAVLLRALHAAGGAEDAVRRVVARHLRWIEDNPQLARLFLHSPPDVLRTMLDDAALDAKRGFAEEIDDWLRGHGWSGAPDLTVVVALWIGPVHEYARGWLASPGPSPALVSDALAEGAWRAVGPLLRSPGGSAGGRS
ncbi:TetR/AcrR family transcriptional regulator [Pseudonocardia halophobica]|nr:TetR/AcrR family transcriptional regulator [Pseudonocardia halophobica]